jgi:hypothetical protein
VAIAKHECWTRAQPFVSITTTNGERDCLLSNHVTNTVPDDAKEIADQVSAQIEIVENPVIVVPEYQYPEIGDSFYHGLSEGMYAFGVFFPFLVIFLIGWLATILWIPFAIRLARRAGIGALQSVRELRPDSEIPARTDTLK